MIKFIFSPSIFTILLLTVVMNAEGQQQGKTSNVNQLTLAQQLESYNKAEKIAREAIKQLEQGNNRTGDSLIRRSISLYPTRSAMEYAEVVAQLPNMLGANAVIYEILNRLGAMPEERVIVSVPGSSQIIGGVLHFVKYKKGALDKVDALHMLAGNEAYRILRNFGSRQDFERLLNYILAIKNANRGNPKISGVYRTMAQVELYRLQKRYDEAIELKQIDGTTNELVSLYFDKGSYEQVISMLSGRNDDYANAVLFSTYVRLDDNERAQRYYDKLIKSNNAVLKNAEVIYYDALLEINKKNYLSAQLKLRELLANRKMVFMNGNTSWTVYTALGRAYAGLHQYEMAKDNFNIALFYYPDYQDAIDALLHLEADHASLLSKDITGPAILFREPNMKGDMRVTTTQPVLMIEGIAKDPGGIKEILFNDQKVYSQASGAFWGEVKLGDGLNEIKVSAKDISDNVSVKVIFVQKEPLTILKSEIVPVSERQGKNYCLLIAAQDYNDEEIPRLSNPIADAVKLKLMLKNRYTFDDDNIISLFNPKANDLKRQLLELNNFIQPEDNLLIFYAGHGVWKENEQMGYWLLSDAIKSDVNTWVSNKEILGLIAKLPDRHTLLITDACFSGSVFRTRSLEPTSPLIAKKLENKICRVAITSGNATTVPDESVFMKYLIRALSQNKEQYLITQKMFINDILEAVMAESKTEPRYGTLEMAGHLGGDFIFVRRHD